MDRDDRSATIRRRRMAEGFNIWLTSSDAVRGGTMRTSFRSLVMGVLVIGAGQALAAGSARAQGSAPGGSLGGYGGGMGGSGGGMGMGGPIIPYAGRFGGFMPSRMGGGGGELAFQRRSSSLMSPVRPSFSLSSMSDGMSSMSGGLGRGAVPRAGMSGSTGLGTGMGSGGGMGPSMSGGGMGVMPSRIGYPFRQPPSLLGPASGSGMSM
jgi:hypothetical protein